VVFVRGREPFACQKGVVLGCSNEVEQGSSQLRDETSVEVINVLLSLHNLGQEVPVISHDGH